MIIYPAIDILDSKCVRLSQGDFDRKKIYDLDPVKVAQSFESQGATWLHVVDLDGSRAGEKKEDSIIKRIVETTQLKLQVGGGIRSEADAQAYLDMGVKRVIAGSLALIKPALVKTMIRSLGSESLTLSMDVRPVEGEWKIAGHGWEKDYGLDINSFLRNFVSAGLKHLLCTDISRDGMESGPNLELYTQIRDSFPTLAIQASGGVGKLSDLSKVRKMSLSGCIVGRALYEKRFELREALHVK